MTAPGYCRSRGTVVAGAAISIAAARLALKRSGRPQKRWPITGRAATELVRSLQGLPAHGEEEAASALHARGAQLQRCGRGAELQVAGMDQIRSL